MREFFGVEEDMDGTESAMSLVERGKKVQCVGACGWTGSEARMEWCPWVGRA